MGTPRATADRDSGATLGVALLGYMLAVTVIVTLVPFQFETPVQWRVLLSGPPSDIVANVLLFVPLGFLYCFARGRRGRSSTMVVLVVAALASAAIEAVQLFEPSRETSLVDIVTNALGACVGAWIFKRMAKTARNTGRIIGWLALELPLMGAVYLLVPLLWINSLASHGELTRSAMTALIGVFGAVLLGGMQRHYFGPAGVARPWQTAAFAALWFTAGAFPALAWHPSGVAAVAVGVAAVCGWLGRQHLPASASNRRFEVPLLKTAAPIYGAYLALSLLGPLAAGITELRFTFGFPEGASAQVEILRLLERAAALTLAGYFVAEFRGRSVVRFSNALPRIAILGMSLAIVAELARGYDEMHGASLVRAALLAAATIYGGWLYYLQRAHVVRLLSRDRAHDLPRDAAGREAPRRERVRTA